MNWSLNSHNKCGENMESEWLGYRFFVRDHEIDWPDVGGLYIFAGVNAEGDWIPYYIGQTDSFRNRLPNHERWLPAQFCGATHVHVRPEASAGTRDTLERQLIDAFQPALNKQLKAP